MDDYIMMLFVPTYLLYLYWIKRSSAWGYAVITSVLWGPVLHGHVALNTLPIMAIGRLPLGDFIFDWFGQFLFFNLGGVLFSIYVWLVWGINRGKIALVVFSAVPTLVLVPFAVIYVVVFHLFDLILFRGGITEKYSHRDKTQEDYVL